MSPREPNRKHQDARHLLCVLVVLAAILSAGLVARGPADVAPDRAQGILGLAEAPVNLSNSVDRDAEGPRLAVSQGGTVHVVWQEASDSSLGSDVVGRRRASSGAWAAPTVIEYSARHPALTSFDREEAALAFVGGYVEGDGSQKLGIYLKSYDSAARRWPLAGKAIPGGDGGVQPDIGYADGRLWLVWVDTSTGSRRTAWQSRFPSGTPAPRGSTFDGIVENAQAPRIGAARDATGTDLHVVWMDEDGRESWLTHLWMDAKAPTPQVNPDLGPYYAQGLPRLPDVAAAGRSAVCLAWQEVVPLPPPDRRQDVVSACAPWSSAASINDAGRPSGDPALAMDATLGQLLAWRQDDGGTPGASRGLRFRQDLPPLAGSIWEGEVSQPDLAYDPVTGKLHAVWLGRLPGRTDRDVFYAQWAPLLPSPSPSTTSSPSPTRSATPSRTPSPTRTASPTPTPTKDPSVTVEATPTRGTPPSPTRSPSPTTRPSTRTPGPPADILYLPRLEQKWDGVGVR